ncbi:MAG: class I SAM-dependent methyltransferase [Candidatus Cloacimonetes bacterium]|nr:class I SAM-dependent methyltransferase [Candidatus Cloacimonadota bacterium]
MTDNYKRYQENYEFDWNLTPKQENIIQQKVDYIKQLIPKDVKTIIDIGCGTGFITNQLIEKYDVTAVDINEINLKKLKCKTIHSLAHDLALPENSFDLVFSSEMLEHLPSENILMQTIKIFSEISKKYILITVPNNEKLENGFVKCGTCGFIFHSSLHNFSFDRQKLESLFKGFEVIHYNTIGPLRKINESDFLLFLRNNVAGRWAKPNKDSFCPNCKNKNNFVKKKDIFSKLVFEFVSLCSKIISKKKRNWIIMLFEKECL